MNLASLGIFGVIVYFLLKKEINETIMGFIEIFTGTVTDPKVTRAMTILGKESGKSRAQDATTEALAQGVLSGPNLAGIKLAAKGLGVDIDGMIEEYGAVETLAGAKQLGDMLGIDILGVLSQGLTQGINTPQASGKTTGEYLKG